MAKSDNPELDEDKKAAFANVITLASIHIANVIAAGIVASRDGACEITDRDAKVISASSRNFVDELEKLVDLVP